MKNQVFFTCSKIFNKFKMLSLTPAYFVQPHLLIFTNILQTYAKLHTSITLPECAMNFHLM